MLAFAFLSETGINQEEACVNQQVLPGKNSSYRLHPVRKKVASSQEETYVRITNHPELASVSRTSEKERVYGNPEV
jgi:hypothetical protein